jgi:hypothetical protein
MRDELARIVAAHAATVEIVNDQIFISSQDDRNLASLAEQLRPHKQAIIQLARENGGTRLFRMGPPAITPQRLPLVELTQEDIDRIVLTVPGGSSNVQDIYPLAPLQEGILFHYLSARDADPYLLFAQISFADRGKLERYIAGLKYVIGRHDILRTSIAWEGLPEPVQVVWRTVRAIAEEVALDPEKGDIATQLRERFSSARYRLDLRVAPLVRLFFAWDAPGGRWVAVQLMHHMCGDHITMEVLSREIGAFLSGRHGELPPPLPFRDFVAWTRRRANRAESEQFFRHMLEDVHEPLRRSACSTRVARVPGSARRIAGWSASSRPAFVALHAGSASIPLACFTWLGR